MDNAASGACEHPRHDRIQIGQPVHLQRLGQLTDAAADAVEIHPVAVEREQALDVLLVLGAPGDGLVDDSNGSQARDRSTSTPAETCRMSRTWLSAANASASGIRAATPTAASAFTSAGSAMRPAANATSTSRVTRGTPLAMTAMPPITTP